MGIGKVRIDDDPKDVWENEKNTEGILQSDIVGKVEYVYFALKKQKS